MLISESDVSDYYMVMAVTDKGFEYFMVPEGAEGLKHGHIENKIGFKGSRTGTIYFNDVKVPESERFQNSMVFDPVNFDGYYGVMDLGGAEFVFDKTVEYLNGRIQEGGKSLLA